MIQSITPGRFVEAVCISVDSPDKLFVAKDFVLTHNTLYGLGVGISFLQHDHFFKLYDVERTSPLTWVERMFGRRWAYHVGFSAMKPATYEDFRADFREWATRIGNAKVTGKLPADTTGVAVVDCVNKLTPRGFFDKLNADLKKMLEKDASEASAKKKGSRVNGKTTDDRDGAGGRGGQIRVALNAAFLDEAVPLVDDTGTALLLVAREREDPNASMQDRMAGRGYTIRGGSSLIYDASLRSRVERAGWVYKGGKYDEAAGKDNLIYGERLRVRFAKTKIAGKEGREQVGYFHTSNGLLVPTGFDRARDLLEVGTDCGVVRLAGSHYSFGGKSWNGTDQAVRRLTSLPEVMDRIEREVRDKMPNENRDAANAGEEP